MEQSDLKLSGEFFCAHTEWRTICFESHSLEDLLRKEVTLIGSKVRIQDYLTGVPESSVQGYPAFIKSLSVMPYEAT